MVYVVVDGRLSRREYGTYLSDTGKQCVAASTFTFLSGAGS